MICIILYLLQLGDLEGTMGLAGLHLQVVDLHVPLLHLVLNIKLLTKHVTRLGVQLLAQVGEVILAHGANVREGSNLVEDCFRHTHLGVLQRTGCTRSYSQQQGHYSPDFLISKIVQQEELRTMMVTLGQSLCQVFSTLSHSVLLSNLLTTSNNTV